MVQTVNLCELGIYIYNLGIVKSIPTCLVSAKMVSKGGFPQPIQSILVGRQPIGFIKIISNICDLKHEQCELMQLLY